jgi:predicted MPP superfamily phosphohydrolase
MKKVFFALNIIVGLSGYLLIFFIWRYFFGLHDIYMQSVVAGLLALLAILTVLTAFFAHRHDNIFSRAFYLVIGLWSGLMLNTVLVAVFLLLLDWVFFSDFYFLTPLFKAYFLGIFSILMLIPESILAQSFVIKRYVIKIKALPDAWVGRKVIHISDVHLGPVWRQRFFDKLVRRVNSLAADVIFITGDLFDGMEADFSWFHERKFIAPLGVFYAFGNHDLILGADKVHKLLSHADIQILDNARQEIEGLQIIGLTCYYEGRLDVKGKILSSVGYDPLKPSIMMYHEPKDIDAARTAGIDLQLSGHTHAGQLFPFNLLSQILYRGFNHGLYRLPDFSLSVTAGVGTWGPPLRLGSRSEIVVLELSKA